MTLLHLLHKGDGAQRGKLEKFADGCNALGRSFWLGRRMSLPPTQESPSIKKERTLPYKFWVNPSVVLTISICGLPIFIFLGITLAACLTTGVGLLGKKITLLTNKKAQAYSNIVYLSFKKQKQVDKLEALKEKCRFQQTRKENVIAIKESIEEAIRDMPQNNPDPDLKKVEKDIKNRWNSNLERTIEPQMKKNISDKKLAKLEEKITAQDNLVTTNFISLVQDAVTKYRAL